MECRKTRNGIQKGTVLYEPILSFSHRKANSVIESAGFSCASEIGVCVFLLPRLHVSIDAFINITGTSGEK